MVELTCDNGDPININLASVRSITQYPNGTWISFTGLRSAELVKETIHEIAMKAKDND